MTTYVVGLDVSYTNTGVSVFKDGVYRPGLGTLISTTPKEGDHVLRAGRVASEVIKTLDKLKPNDSMNIFIEDYAYARLSNREAMGELGGIVKHELRRHGYGFRTLPISTIRKVVTGKGNSQKDQVMLQLFKRHGLDIDQNDLADAAAVGITGKHVLAAEAKDASMSDWLVDVREAVTSYLKKATA